MVDILRRRRFRSPLDATGDLGSGERSEVRPPVTSAVRALYLWATNLQMGLELTYPYPPNPRQGMRHPSQAYLVIRGDDGRQGWRNGVLQRLTRTLG